MLLKHYVFLRNTTRPISLHIKRKWNLMKRRRSLVTGNWNSLTLKGIHERNSFIRTSRIKFRVGFLLANSVYVCEYIQTHANAMMYINYTYICMVQVTINSHIDTYTVLHIQ
jgi:hypothetical protein